MAAIMKKKPAPQNFECYVIVRPIHRDAFLQVNIAPTHVKWKDKLQTIDFYHIYVELDFKKMVQFDKKLLTNTSSISEGNKVNIKFSSTKVRKNEDFKKETIKTGFNQGPNGEIGEESVESKKYENSDEQETNGTVTDLRLQLFHIDSMEPKWKIYQMNDTPLCMSAKDSYKIGQLRNLNPRKQLDATGIVWTCEEGFKISGQTPGLFSPASTPLGDFKKFLWQRKMEKILASPKQIEIELIRGN